jgi:beta-glucanase (GH16 family)
MNSKNTFFSLAILFFLAFGVQKSFAQCYELVWADEFDSTGFPDPAKWTFEVGNNNGANSEAQYYKNKDTSNCWIENGTLVITAIKEPFGGQQYTSTRINTKGKAEFKYGRIEARMKLPYGQGIWPAFWTLGGNISQVSWPACGEIDIMEMIGGAGDRDRTAYATPHWADASGNHAQYGKSKTLSTGKFCDDFHTFSIEWTSTYIRWYLDGDEFHVMSTTPAALSEFQLQHFIILNLAVGGTWPGYPDGTTVFPQKFEIDYVRVYQQLNKELIQGKDSVFTNEKNLSYSLTPLEGRQFQWTVPDGATIVSGADSNVVVVDWGCAAGTVSCSVTTSCATTYTLTKKVGIIHPVISGPMFYNKPVGNLFFFVPEMNETTYQWDIPEGASFIAGNSNDSAVVSWGTGAGLINLLITNTCGTFPVSKKIYSYGQYPYPNPEAPFVIPGTINSTDYDFGGEGVAYHDFDVSNQGTVGLREDERVDTELQPLFPNVGWINPGEWLEYTIAVPTAGYYKIEMKVSSGATSSIGPIRVYVNGVARVGDIPVVATAGWSTFVKVSQRLLYLDVTDTVLKILAVKGNFNLGPITIAVDPTVSVKELEAGKSGLGLFPNPVNDFLNINLRLMTPGDITINVMNISGGQVFSTISKCSVSGEQNIEITDKIKTLNPGIYFVEIITADQKYFSKFLKN